MVYVEMMFVSKLDERFFHQSALLTKHALYILNILIAVVSWLLSNKATYAYQYNVISTYVYDKGKCKFMF